MATSTVPIVHIAHDAKIDDFLPKLSEKKEMTVQPMKAPKQIQLLTRSMTIESLQIQTYSVAMDSKVLSSDAKQLDHYADGSQQTYFVQNTSLISSPFSIQSKLRLRKRKAVLRSMMPVTNQLIRKMNSITLWYLPLSPTFSIRLKQVFGLYSDRVRLRCRISDSRNDIMPNL